MAFWLHLARQFLSGSRHAAAMMREARQRLEARAFKHNFETVG
jgi:hypothetical protein